MQARKPGFQEPVKAAFRFSRNALVPSRMSAVALSRPKVSRLEPEGLVHRHVEAGIHQVEARSHRQRPVLQDAAEQPLGFRQQLVRRHDAVHQPDAPGLLGVDHRAR